MSADIVLTIAAPPSANRLYRMVRGHMAKSTFYREWKDAQALAIANQLGGAGIVGHFHCGITVPTLRIDLDNAAKPLLDAMQAGGAFTNDRLCVSLNMVVDFRREQGSVLVNLWAAEGPPKKTRARKRVAA